MTDHPAPLPTAADEAAFEARYPKGFFYHHLSPEDQAWFDRFGTLPPPLPTAGQCHTGQNPWAGRASCPD